MGRETASRPGTGGRALLGDAIVAGATATVLSGVPSTVHALASGRDPFAATLAAGSILLRHEERQGRLLAAAVPVHLALSLGWALVLAVALPRRRTALAGAAAGLAIAAVDLGVAGRRVRRVRSLALAPQLADQLAYGTVVGALVARRRARRL